MYNGDVITKVLCAPTKLGSNIHQNIALDARRKCLQPSNPSAAYIATLSNFIVMYQPLEKGLSSVECGLIVSYSYR